MTARRLALVVLVAFVAFPAPAPAADAAKTFATSCAPCHGKQGEPNGVFAKQGGRSFKDAAWQKAATDAQIEKSIREGKQGTMMARCDQALSDEEIKALVAHIRQLGKK